MSPRTTKQFEAIREEKRTLIMDAALEHFAKEGYHKTTITHLAKHAGISKGLMYNYFSGKEELLAEIINRSASEVTAYFDPDKDGILTEEEFELFVRKFITIIKEKVVFWRLFYQLMLQKDVRDQLLSFISGSPPESGSANHDYFTAFKSEAIKIIFDYFNRKKDRKPAGYDAAVDMNMFIYTIQGFAMVAIFSESIDDATVAKTADKIIETYK